MIMKNPSVPDTNRQLSVDVGFIPYVIKVSEQSEFGA